MMSRLVVVMTHNLSQFIMCRTPAAGALCSPVGQNGAVRRLAYSRDQQREPICNQAAGDRSCCSILDYCCCLDSVDWRLDLTPLTLPRQGPIFSRNLDNRYKEHTTGGKASHHEDSAAEYLSCSALGCSIAVQQMSFQLSSWLSYNTSVVLSWVCKHFQKWNNFLAQLAFEKLLSHLLVFVSMTPLPHLLVWYYLLTSKTMAEQNQWPESMADCKFYEQVGLAALLYSLGWQDRQSKNHRAFWESKRFSAF